MEYSEMLDIINELVNKHGDSIHWEVWTILTARFNLEIKERCSCSHFKPHETIRERRIYINECKICGKKI